MPDESQSKKSDPLAAARAVLVALRGPGGAPQPPEGAPQIVETNNSGIVPGRGRKLPARTQEHRAKLSRAGMGNLNSSRSPWRSFLRRCATKKEHKFAWRLAADTVESIAADLPDLTAAEETLLRNLAMLQASAALAVEQVAKDGAFVNGEAHEGLGAAARLLSEVRQHVALLGTKRRAKSSVSLAEYLQTKMHVPASEAVLTVEAVEREADKVDATGEPEDGDSDSEAGP